jgi:hypothetical protein
MRQNRIVFAPPLTDFYLRVHILYRSRPFVREEPYLEFSLLFLLGLVLFRLLQIDIKKKESNENIPHKSAGFSGIPRHDRLAYVFLSLLCFN